MENITKHKYGWHPSIPDQRDVLFSQVARRPRRLPQAVDLRPGCSPVEDQGQLGSCTAQALVGSMEFLQLKAKKPLTDLSRLFLYYQERLVEGTVSSDSGAMIRDGIKCMAKYGVCKEALWTYDIGQFTRKPPAAAYKDALTRQILSYSRLLTLIDCQVCLAAGFPFVFGFSVYESFESDEVAKTGIVPMPKKGEQLLGGHAVMAVGYNMAHKRFIVRNSWGSSWAMSGYFTLPFGYITNRNLSDDFWTVRTEELP